MRTWGSFEEDFQELDSPPWTSLVILAATLVMNSWGKLKAVAVMKSVVSTARKMTISAWTRLSPWPEVSISKASSKSKAKKSEQVHTMTPTALVGSNAA